MKSNLKAYFIILNLIGVLIFQSCKKVVEVGDPNNTLTTSETFSTNANATAAVAAIYNNLISGQNDNGLGYGNGLTTFDAGLSSDEFFNFDQSNSDAVQLQNNDLTSTNGIVQTYFWNAPYANIYIANAAIEGLQASTTIATSVKNQLTGEAKFLRAFNYFYLVNLFGDVPLVTSTAYAKNATLSRTPSAQVYQQIVNDLQASVSSLPIDYSAFGGSVFVQPNGLQLLYWHEFIYMKVIGRTQPIRRVP